MSLCGCGCGQEIKIKSHHKYTGIPKYIKGHNQRNKKFSDEHRKKLSESHKENTVWNKGLKNCYSKETLKKMSENNHMHTTNQKGTSNYSWKGGCNIYWHDLAWKNFGKYTCQYPGCKITNNEHIDKYGCRLHMHCISEPKNYKIQTKENWQTYCIPHHLIIEKKQE